MDKIHSEHPKALILAELRAEIELLQGRYARVVLERDFLRRALDDLNFFDNAHDGIVFTDADHQVVYANPYFLQMMSVHEPEQLLNQPFPDHIWSDPEEARRLFEDIRANGFVRERELTLRDTQGSPVFAVCSAVASQEENEFVGAELMFCNITSKRLLQAEAIEQNALLEAILASTPDPILVLGADLSIIRMNSAAEALFRFSEPQPAYQLTSLLQELGLADARIEDIHNHLNSNEQAHIELQMADRHFRWNTAQLSAAAGGWVCVLHDITEHKRAAQQLEHTALQDALTGLPNRRHFLRRLNQVAGRGRPRKDHRFALLFIDVDRLKRVNDAHGHKVGDLLLQEVGRRIESCLRSADMAARLGGDEFAIFLDGVSDEREARRVAERINDALSQPFSVDGHQINATASIGIALNAPDSENPEEFLREADIAMYRAKDAGRARVEVFDSAMRMYLSQRLQLESDLRKAIEQAELRVHYQPIISLISGQISGFEALARWQRADGQLILPAEFLPVAEETGLILDIDLWMMEQACLEARSWRSHQPSAPPRLVCVNLSGKHFAHSDLARQVKQVLDSTGLEGQYLRIEVTESAIMADVDSTIDTLIRLKDLGVHLHVDDFGTGYSSLSYLHRLPIHTLKMDRAFTNALNASDESQAIVRTILSLAESLGMEVTAKGVESAVQLEVLRQMGCHHAQGWFFSHPVPGPEAETLALADPHW